MKPKVRLFLRLVGEQMHELGNPRGFWTCNDESLTVAVSVMAAASADPRGGSSL